MTDDGKEVVHFNKIKVKFNTTKFYMHYDSSNPSEKILSDTINDLLNNHWKDILEDFRSTFEHSMEDLIKSIIEPLFASLPYSEFFLS